jgi:peptide/nickel transport system substrate-binding protein/oligopeptide transport system substrate-binding protein
MLKSVRLIFPALVWGCWLLIHHAAGVAIALEKPEPGDRFGGVYHRMLPNNPPTLDPAFMNDVYARAVATQIFDGLVQFDALLNPIPAIAEFWEASRDGRTWTFYLRRGVKFHHGREVTADDFVYSFTRQLDAKKPGRLTEFLRRIKGANDFMQGTTHRVEGLKAVTPSTLQIELDEPFAPLLAVLGLGNAAVVPREEVERQKEQFGRSPVGTGPFKLVRWEQDKEIVLEANDRYYEGRPFLDKVMFKVGGTFEEMFAEFLEGRLEETLIPSARTDEVRIDPRYRQYQKVRKPTLGLLYIGFNTQLKPFDDVRVRQAFSYAVNREKIVREITRMGSIPASVVLPPGMPGHDPDLKMYYYDPDKAKRLLAEAGYPDGAGFPVVQLWMASKTEATHAELAAYQEYLAKIGVKVEIRSESDWPTYVSMLNEGKLPMFRLSWTARIPDPDDFLSPQLHSTGANNWAFYRNPQVDQLLDQARKELNYAQRIALYRDVERIVKEDAPWITQHYNVFERLYQPYVNGVEVSFLGDWAIPMKKIWLKKSPTEGTVGAMPGARPSR